MFLQWYQSSEISIEIVKHHSYMEQTLEKLRNHTLKGHDDKNLR